MANVRSVTRMLDTWGKRIFNEIKALLHSQPNTLLPDYSRYTAVHAHLYYIDSIMTPSSALTMSWLNRGPVIGQSCMS